MSAACGNRVHRPTREYLGEGRRLATVHHASSDEVRACFTTDGGVPTLEDQQLAEEHLAEARAEDGYERWLEDGGPHAAAIQAEAEHERRREEAAGVLPFGEAMREAERELRGQVCSGDVHGPFDDECKGAHCVQPRRF